MSFLSVAAENLLLIVVLPWLVHTGALDLAERLDNRGMFSIPFCWSLAIACGSLLAIATGVFADFTKEVSAASLWDISGFWHEVRFVNILAGYIGDLSFASGETIPARHILFSQILLGCAGALTAVNCVIAVLGWRSFGALRGMAAHVLIGLSVWIVLTVGVLAGFWVIHWLNFWVFLVLLIVLEMRRREEGVTRLSF